MCVGVCVLVSANNSDIYVPLKETWEETEEGLAGLHLPSTRLTTWTSWQKGPVDRLISPRWLTCLFFKRGMEGGGRGGGGRLTDNPSVYTLPLLLVKGSLTECVWEVNNRGKRSKFHQCCIWDFLWQPPFLSHTFSHAHTHIVPSGRPHG